MPTDAFTSSAAAVSSATAVLTVLDAFTSTSAAVSSAAAWPHVLNVTGSPLQRIPYFTVPDGWPFSPTVTEP